jgi:HEAT repeat protein
MPPTSKEAFSEAMSEAIRSVGGTAPPTIPKLVVALNDEATEVGAEQALVGIGAPAIPALMDVVRSDNQNSRRAARVLGLMGKAAAPAVPELAAMTQNYNFKEADAAAEALGHIGVLLIKDVDALRAGLLERGTALSTAAAFALGNIGPQSSAKLAIPDLEKMLTNDGHMDSAAAAAALVKLGEEKAGLDYLCRQLEGSPSTANHAAQALAWLGPLAKDAVGPLTKAAQSKVPAVADEAIKALGKIGPAARSAVPILESIKDNSYTKAALESILAPPPPESSKPAGVSSSRPARPRRTPPPPAGTPGH